MNVARDLNLRDLVLFSFCFRERTLVRKKKLGSLCKVLILCDFFLFGLSQNFRDVAAAISHRLSIFVLDEAK